MNGIILGSQSPQRRQLLSQLFPDQEIRVLPPLDSNEKPFPEQIAWQDLISHLQEIARTKNDQVADQINQEDACHLLTADTVIVVRGPQDHFQVLGKPGADWQADVRDWFMNHYSGRVHWAVSAICLRTPTGKLHEATCETSIRMKHCSSAEIDWYLSTKESIGKAGGYGIQGLGSLFVTRITGSLTNVVGLPLELTKELFETASEQ